jgi:hypothetical protein
MHLDLVVSPHSALRELVLANLGDSAAENEQFQAVIEGLVTASCRIQRLKLDETISDAHLNALLNALPNFQ